MKAFLLAAGLGTRLKPITDTVPKCLVSIRGKALLEWWFKLFEKYGITEVLVNTHYLSEKVEQFIQSYSEKNAKLHISVFYEEKLLGSGGTVNINRDFVNSEEDFLICYADNLTDVNLQELTRIHKKNKAILTMALFHTNVPKQCGIATINQEGIVTEFKEKPENPRSNLANAGIYVANKRIYQYFPDKAFCDFGKDILPKLVGKMYGYEIDAYLRDIGTLENLELARKEWKHDYF